ncbi:MAG: GreA/GreB family elongation factor [Thermoleophilaceae bacterium]
MTTHLSTDTAVREPGQHSTTSNGGTGHAAGTTPMTAARLEELRNELARVRRRARLQIAQELGEARSFGEGSNNDEYHAVREEQMVLEAHLAALEQRIERATVVGPDEAARGAAAIGSTVSIEDLASGTTRRYRLTSAHQSLGPDVISAASPVGRALVGALPGVTVTVDLPNGRSRSVRLVDVVH